MQDRRTLFYVTRDDIPSSAELVTSSSQQGNVLYLPIGTNATSGNYNIYSASNTRALLVAAANEPTGDIRYMEAGSTPGGKYFKWNKSGRYLSYGDYSYILLCPYAMYSANSSGQKWNLNKRFIPKVLGEVDSYIKLNFDGNVEISNADSSCGAYIDTEA